MKLIIFSTVYHCGPQYRLHYKKSSTKYYCHSYKFIYVTIQYLFCLLFGFNNNLLAVTLKNYNLKQLFCIIKSFCLLLVYSKDKIKMLN